MFRWLRRWRGRTTGAPLTGAPSVRRQKNYSAQSGYVYQYFYEGHRTAERHGEPCTEYVFEVSADRRSGFRVSIFLPEASLSAWVAEHQRDLTAAERYGLVKLALFQAFDERPSPPDLAAPVELRTADVMAIAETLDL